MIVLGIETSCDETAVAVLEGNRILSSIVSSQVDLHAKYGGVVPEIASRSHVERILEVIDIAFAQANVKLNGLDAIAATKGPGLIGALSVGLVSGKALAISQNIPFVGVNHHEAHFFGAFLENDPPELPAVILLVSGGHTMLVFMQEFGKYKLLGQTLNDAAGEAFDKVARYLSLGYPGGPAIERVAQSGDPQRYEFPGPIFKDSFDFSFSGLKTAVIRFCKKMPEAKVEDIAASFQYCVADSLKDVTLRAARHFGVNSVVLAGGVGANTLLRNLLSVSCQKEGLKCYLPSKKNCTDNAAMVAYAGRWHLEQHPGNLMDGAAPNLRLEFEN